MQHSFFPIELQNRNGLPADGIGSRPTTPPSEGRRSQQSKFRRSRVYSLEFSSEPQPPSSGSSSHFRKINRKDKFLTSMKRYPRMATYSLRSLLLAPYYLVAEPLHSFKAWYRKRKMLPPSKNGRHISVELEPSARLIDERTLKPYCNNLVTSAKYSIYDFLPRQLIYQFSKLANIYFLVVSILQMIPTWSTTGNYTTIVPLMIFVTISIMREGYDDFCRHRNDRIENLRKSLVATKGIDGHVEYKDTLWKNIKVGNIVRILQNEWVPADVVLLHSSDVRGHAFVETMALDGETTLKTKETHYDIQNAVNPDSLPTFHAECITEDPNIDLYNFDGSFIMDDGTRIPLSNANIVYRGSVLRNTSSCFGLVVFTGKETKVQINTGSTSRSKAPKLQTRVNYIVIILAIFVVLLSTFSMVAATRIQSSHDYWYLDGGDVGVAPILMGFIIMFNTLIPLSLYVSLEISKIFQVWHMNCDIDMYDEVNDVPCRCLTASLNEELGQVSYVFTDKTGTLTDNIMIFRKLSVAGYAYIHDLDLMQEALDDQHEGLVDSESDGADKKYLFHKANIRGHSLDLFDQIARLPRKSMAGTSAIAGRPSTSAAPRPSTSNAPRASGRSIKTHWTSNANPLKPQNLPNTLVLVEYLLSRPRSIMAQKAKFFILAMALCHCATPEVDLTEEGDGTLRIEQLDYQASSPDELALVSAARDLGFLVIDRQHNSITLRTYPNGFEYEPADEVYQVLDVIDFTSSRKRMSIIIRMPNDQICIFTKGADNVMIERLNSSIIAQAKSKQMDISRDNEIRRSAEAECMGPNRASTSSGPRNSIQQINPKTAYYAIEEHLQRAHQESAIQESGRRSMQRRSGETSGRLSNSASLGRPDSHRRDPSHHDDIPSDQNAANERFVLEKTLEHIDEFSTEGLRTLLYAHRFLSDAEYKLWKAEFDEARSSLSDRQENTERVADKIENEYELTGATAIEDKLQIGVPEAIDKLRRANIRMWMLTGDKRETAINIGYSCRLIKDYSTLIVLKKAPELSTTIMAAMETLAQDSIAHCVVVVDGQTLAVISEDPTLMSMFIDLGLSADSVICCRASPAQKALLVTSVRKRKASRVVLAIGDGANDIAMIKAADLGIGIAGKEGLQAARSADYSIGQFRFLLKLLLVHGRWNYVRTCKYILGTFYKEFLFYLSQLYYQSNTMFTGTSVFENWSISMFNTLFTSLPVIALGVIDQDLGATTLIAVPELYHIGQENKSFSVIKFLAWCIQASLQSAAISFLAYHLWGYRSKFIDNSIYPLGVVIYAPIVILICAKLAFFELSNNINVVSTTLVLISVAGYLCWNLLIGGIFTPTHSKTYFVSDSFRDGFGQSLSFWAVVVVIIAICCVWEFIVSYTRQQIRPTDVDIFRVLEKDPFIRERLENEAEMELRAGWEYQKQLDTSWFAFFRGKWPAQSLPRRKEAVTSRRRRRDVFFRKIFNRADNLDREIEDIIRRREMAETEDDIDLKAAQGLSRGFA